MRKNIFYLTIIIFYLLNGCKDKPIKSYYKEISSIKLDFQKKMKSVHDINLINDVDIISLDCDEVIIGNIDKVIKFDTIIYLMDKDQNKSIYLFNLQGDFIHSISNYGQGPEEYIQLTDMFIDPLDSSLNVLSRMDKKLFKYDLRGDELRVIEKTPKSFSSMKKTEKGYMANMGNYIEDMTKRSNLWLLNENVEITDHYFEIDEMWESRYSKGGSTFSDYKDMNYYITPMDYNIYMITDRGVNIKYIFDLGKLQWPKITKADVTNDKKLRELIDEYLFRFYNFQETDNHLIIKFLYKGQDLLGVYNKEKQEVNITTLEAYKDKYFFGFGDIIGFDEKTIYSIIDSEDIKRMWDGKDEYNNYEEKYPTQVANLRKKFKTIREDGNPFLVMYSIN